MRKILGLVALVLALALGIALGAGPLGDRIDSGRVTDRHGTDDDAAAGSDPLDAALIGALAPGLLAGKLTGQSVALVALPGARASTLTALSAEVAAAGGAVASTTRVTTGLTGAGGKQLVDSLGSQLIAQLPSVVDPALTTYPRIGALLGAALTTRAAPAPPTPAVTTIRESLATGKLISGTVQGNAGTLTLVVTGDGLDETIATGLVSGLRTQSRGLVVAGDANDGDVAAVRDAHLAVGTYDGVETAAGQVGSILGLARQIAAPGGDFGASGADGSLPLR